VTVRRVAPRVVGLLAVAALCATWAVILRPDSLGGPAGYVMVRGVSMRPTYHTGDLVITRQERTYRKGDVVAYRVPEGQVGEGIIVIHRIVGGSARNGYVVKGDNNPAPDDWHPHPQDVKGKAWLVVPRAGDALAWLHAPVPLASIAAGIAVAVVLVPVRDRQPSQDGDGRGAGDGVVAEDAEDRERRRKRSQQPHDV
jgi:signal peptidase